MYNGIINIYKEQDYTSFDVVAKLRGILKQKKIGHTGTLDPMAEGVLIVCLGKATKLVDMLTVSEKRYRAVMKLGLETDTEDITGEVIANKGYDGSFDDQYIKENILGFVGCYDQIPPMYSAIKKDGKKLYEYARKGVTVERTPRSIEIYDISNIAIQNDEVSFDVRCSKGTYIRSLCRDIGTRLGCGATLAKLIRLEVHGNLVENSIKLSEVEKLVSESKLDSYIVPIEDILNEYESFQVKNGFEKYLTNGNILYKNQILSYGDDDETSFDNGDIIKVFLDDEFMALYEYNAEIKAFKPYKMFL